MDRPALTSEISPEDFKDFYWLKAELVEFCKSVGIDSSGGKIEISHRIFIYLNTGKIPGRSLAPKRKATSSFDWKKERLSLETKLTDNYSNTENLRQFLVGQIGAHFRFTVDFMRWAKSSTGKTLGDAINEWKRLYERKKEKDFKTEIGPQFEYNRYIRAFLEDNPGKTTKEAMKFWKQKKAMRGSKEYLRSDLELT